MFQRPGVVGLCGAVWTHDAEHLSSGSRECNAGDSELISITLCEMDGPEKVHRGLIKRGIGSAHPCAPTCARPSGSTDKWRQARRSKRRTGRQDVREPRSGGLIANTRRPLRNSDAILGHAASWGDRFPFRQQSPEGRFCQSGSLSQDGEAGFDGNCDCSPALRNSVPTRVLPRSIKRRKRRLSPLF